VLRRFEDLGIGVQIFELPEDVTNAEFLSAFREIDALPSIHGVLLFRPLRSGLDENAAKKAVSPLKDVDGMSPRNAADIFAGLNAKTAFPPCTPAAVIETLDHYGVALEGKNVAIVGRSLVVGRPLAMLMLARNATVTICHTRTKGTENICRSADIIVAAAGKARVLTPAFVSPKSVVVDVGINVDENGKLCGDVDYDAVAPLVEGITPVPGGIGTVTTSVLAKHVLRAAAMLTAQS
jgi:methylenetetrahydrofolate dehydrogenase (NADP+)/methenyltetrahydrofolate cyclohydrolase